MSFNLLTTTGDIQVDQLLMGVGRTYVPQLDWNPLTAPTFNDRSSPYMWDWGATSGMDTYGTRKLRWTVFIQGSSSADLITKINALTAAFSPQTSIATGVPTVVERELSFQLGSAGYTYYGQPRGVEITRLDHGRFTAWAECRWEALDPRYYSNTTTTVTNASVASGSGTTAMTQQTTLATASAPTPWQVIIRPNSGTVTRPYFLDNSGIFFVQYSNSGTPIASGKEVYLDGRLHLAYYRDAVTAANSTDVTHLIGYDSVWWDFPAMTNGDAWYGRIAATVTQTWIVTYRKCFI